MDRFAAKKIHELQKSLLFKDADATTVSGESVVVSGVDTVDKYMFLDRLFLRQYCTPC